MCRLWSHIRGLRGDCLSLTLFADNSIPNPIIKELTEAGHQVLWLRTYWMLHARGGPEKRLRVQQKKDNNLYWLKKGYNADSEDLSIIFQAQRQYTAIFLCLDEDFTDLVKYPPAKYKGIIAVQIRNNPTLIPQIIERLKAYLSAHPDMEYYNGKLISVELDRIRVWK